MSGGVDSAVAAARAVEAGHEVVGVHLALSRNSGTLRTGSRGCCTIEDSMDAQRAANTLGTLVLAGGNSYTGGTTITPRPFDTANAALPAGVTATFSVARQFPYHVRKYPTLTATPGRSSC